MNVPQVSSEQMLVHFYRAVVAHADVWRQRMDATTNWAAATTAGMITVTFGIGAPHFVLLLALAFDVVFLLMESRRYRTYHIWRTRLNTLNRYLVAPVLDPAEAPDPEERRRQLARLAHELGGTTPDLPLAQAVGFRVHRNYGYVFGIVVLSWLLKLMVHPVPAGGVGDVVERAAIGPVAGAAVIGGVVAFCAAAAVLALSAPTERMVAWAESPPALRRWSNRMGRSGTKTGERD
jgi:uncharacterized membrane protein